MYGYGQEVELIECYKFIFGIWSVVGRYIFESLFGFFERYRKILNVICFYCVKIRILIYNFKFDRLMLQDLSRGQVENLFVCVFGIQYCLELELLFYDWKGGEGL